jgi:hypothetical protein
MTGKPLLLVDIDGVISLFGWRHDQRPDGLWTQVEGIAHLLSPTAARSLLDLMSDFDPVWCSGWEERANENLPHLLGLGPWPVLHFDRARGAGASSAGAIGAAGASLAGAIGAAGASLAGAIGAAGASLAGHWKLDAIDAYCGPERAVAWVDDVLDDACERWAADRVGPTLLVRTQPWEGLTAAQVLALRAWVQTLPTGQAGPASR